MPLTDAAVIREALRPFGRERESLSWIGRPWILAVCFGPAILLMLVAAAVGTFSPMAVAGIVFCFSTYFSLFLLSDRPLFNPFHAIVLLFHHWFGIAAGVCSAYYLYKEKLSYFVRYYYMDPAPLWLVAAGLPLFALVCRLATARWPHDGASFLRTPEPTYPWRRIITYAVVGFGVQLSLMGLGSLGFSASTGDGIGGTVTVSNPVLLAYLAIAVLVQLALYSVIHKAFVQPHEWKRYKWPIILWCTLAAVSTLASGTKGAIVTLAAYALMAYITFRQRFPTFGIVAVAGIYVTFLAPFIDNSRLIGQAERITTPEQRQEILRRELVRRVENIELVSDIDIESPFRGMLNVSSDALEVGGDWHGRWEGRTIEEGLSTLLPRSLAPEKADANHGNFFARELGQIGYDVFDHNIVLSIPVEVAANYGNVAGVLAFIPLGMFTAGITLWLFGPNRLATHPLSGWTFLLFNRYEASLGQWAASQKSLPGLFIGLAVVAMYLRWDANRRVQTTSAPRLPATDPA